MATQLVLSHDIAKQADGALPIRTILSKSGSPLDGVPTSLIEQSAVLSGGQGFAYNFTGTNFPQHPAFTVASSPYYMGGWVVNAVGTGATSVLVGGDGGLVITPGSTDEDNTNITTTGEPFRYSATGKKRTLFAIRCKIADVDKTDLYLGLAIKETPQVNIAASALDITDGIAFWKAATATAISFDARKNSTSTSITSATTLTDGGTYTFAFTVAADGSLNAYQGTTFENLTLLTTLAAGAANICDDEDLAVTITVGAEGTGQPAVTIYDLLFWQER